MAFMKICFFWLTEPWYRVLQLKYWINRHGCKFKIRAATMKNTKYYTNLISDYPAICKNVSVKYRQMDEQTDLQRSPQMLYHYYPSRLNHHFLYRLLQKLENRYRRSKFKLYFNFCPIEDEHKWKSRSTLMVLLGRSEHAAHGHDTWLLLRPVEVVFSQSPQCMFPAAAHWNSGTLLFAVEKTLVTYGISFEHGVVWVSETGRWARWIPVVSPITTYSKVFILDIVLAKLSLFRGELMPNESKCQLH